MREDEAFVRAIVANPGDDATRLVYADWLDDHSDPRGSYLRAEHEWARPWRKGERPTDSGELRSLATVLDSFWVARISRPPLGVCCEHLTLSDGGPPLDDAVIAEGESRLGYAIAPQFRAFLLAHNGGIPKPRYYWPDDRRENNWVAIDRFYSLEAESTARGNQYRDLVEASKVLNNGYVVRTSDRAAREAWEAGTRHYAPLAKTTTLGVVALGLNGKRAGKVYAINRILLAGSSPPRLVAPSLGGFLALFRDQ